MVFQKYLNLCLLSVMALASRLEGATPVYNPMPIHEAFVSKFTDLSPLEVVSKQPPSPIEEIIPAQPFADAIWVPGYWAYVNDIADFVYVYGVWRRPPPQHGWISGEWVAYDEGFAWLRGFWSLDSHLRVIDKAPPLAVEDNVPAPPGENYFWIPGYWEYSYETKQYTWASGKWWSLSEDFVLAPATYILRLNGVVFVPAYWDFTLTERGKAFRRYGLEVEEIPTGDIINQLFISYPDHLSLFYHWCYFFPDWWSGSWCLPAWWEWPEWWTFSWSDTWGLWWWWGHPGSLPPDWMSVELSMKLAPPLQPMVDFFENVPKPEFTMRSGRRVLLPRATRVGVSLQKPFIPNVAKPRGQAQAPRLPEPTVSMEVACRPELVVQPQIAQPKRSIQPVYAAHREQPKPPLKKPWWKRGAKVSVSSEGSSKGNYPNRKGFAGKRTLQPYEGQS